MATWTRYALSDASTSIEAMRNALADLASDPPPIAPGDSDIGVVVFDRLTDAVLRSVGDLSRGGTIRILAVGISPTALDDRGSWPLLDAGASDVVVESEPEQLAPRVSARLARWTQIEELVRSPLVRDELAGESVTWTAVLREIVEVARFSDAPVLLVGESGTGKDVVARLIHKLDTRPFVGPFVKLDCRRVDGAWAETDLFGGDLHAASGGEGSVSAPSQLGVAISSGGTLYLDEVESLPAAFRGALLRAIDEAGAARDGDWPSPNVRLICSTSTDTSVPDLPSVPHDLARRTAARHRLPPLRERTEDIPAIAEHLLRRAVPEEAELRLEPDLAAFLMARDYPSNVHDLLTLVTGIGARHIGPGAVTVGALPPHERRPATAFDLSWHGEGLARAIGRAIDAGASLKAIAETARSVAVRIALEREGGDARNAARRLGTTTKAVLSRDGARSLPAPTVEADPAPPKPIVEVPDSALVAAGELRANAGTRRASTRSVE